MHINDYPEFIKKYDISIGFSYFSETEVFRFEACTIYDIAGDGKDDSYHLIDVDKTVEVLNMKNLNLEIFSLLDELEEKINKLVESDQVTTAPNSAR